MQAYARTAARRAGPVVAGAAAALTVNDEAHDANSDASAPSDASSDRFKRLQSRFEDVCGEIGAEWQCWSRCGVVAFTWDEHQLCEPG